MDVPTPVDVVKCAGCGYPAKNNEDAEWPEYMCVVMGEVISFKACSPTCCVKKEIKAHLGIEYGTFWPTVDTAGNEEFRISVGVQALSMYRLELLYQYASSRSPFHKSAMLIQNGVVILPVNIQDLLWTGGPA